MIQIKEELLWDYVEGKLSGAEKLKVEKWLAADRGRLRELEEVRALSGSLRSMEAEMPPMRFSARVMEAWDAELALHSMPLSTRTDKRIVLLIAAMFGICLVAMFGILIAQLPRQEDLFPGNLPGKFSLLMEDLFSGKLPYVAILVITGSLILAERYLHYRNYIRSVR